MGGLGDLFGPSGVPYPTPTPSNGQAGGSLQQPAATGFFNRFFAPTDLPYPVPARLASGPILNPLTPTQPTAPAPQPMPPTSTGPASGPSAAAPPPASAPSPTPVQSASPVTVIVQSCAAPTSDNAPTSSSSTQSGKSTSAMPVGNCPTPPNEQIVTAFATNPRLRARTPRGQEIVIEELTGENVSLRMLSKDSAPVAFVVPDGCDAVDFTFGPIELNPGHGRPGDLDEVVTVGALKVDALDPVQPLAAGDQLTVVVPWRHGSWVELAADRLRLPIIARFYQIENA